MFPDLQKKGFSPGSVHVDVLQQRLGLLGPDRLPSVSSAFILAAVAWAPLALLSAAQGGAWSKILGARAFLPDFEAYARFIIAGPVLVIMERIVAERSADMVRQFMDAGLVLP